MAAALREADEGCTVARAAVARAVAEGAGPSPQTRPPRWRCDAGARVCRQVRMCRPSSPSCVEAATTDNALATCVRSAWR